MSSMAEPVQSAGVLKAIALDELYESPLNPRHRFDQVALDELAASLRSVGQLTPITARPKANGKKGRYEIGAGHRRYRAAALAGMDELLVVVRELDDPAFVELLNVENLQRDDLHPLEEAEGFKQLMTTCGYDVAKIAARIGRSTRYVYDSLTLLKLVPAAKKLFLAGAFERGHAIELARLAPTDQDRAIGGEDRMGRGLNGLFVPELVDEGGLDLDGDEPRKPVTVREFKHWIDDQVRFRPATVDPVLFPDTVQTLTAAGAAKEKVIEITYDQVIPDAARLDGAPRVYGAQAWRSATKGIPDPDFSGKDSGKACDHAITGVVVIGERRAEAFKVCIAKEKCAVHWKAWQDARQRNAKDRASGRSDRADARQAKADESWKAREAKEAAERKRWEKAAPEIRKAIEAKIAGMEVTSRGPIAARVVQAVAAYGRKPVTGKTLADLVRALAVDLIRRDLSNSWRAAAEWPKVGKAFGVDVKKIVEEASPPEPKVPAKTKSTPKAKKGKKR
jgi:ParB/RepB/Spo0J family partition protein